MKIDFTPTARARLREITRYLAAVNPLAAQKLLSGMDRAVGRLARFPRLGHGVPEFADLPIRQVIVHPYRLFFVLDDARKTVWVVDVWHGAQLPSRPKLPISEPDVTGR
jgi:plasmid stabilization system protein ParE